MEDGNKKGGQSDNHILTWHPLTILCCLVNENVYPLGRKQQGNIRGCFYFFTRCNGRWACLTVLMPARKFSQAVFRSFSLSSSLQRLLFGTTKANIYCPICLCCIRVLPSSSQETLQGQSYRYEPLLLLHRAYRTFDQRWWNLVHLCELRISVDWVYHDNHFDYIHLKTVTKSDLMDVELARDGEISNRTQGNGYR